MLSRGAGSSGKSNLLHDSWRDDRLFSCLMRVSYGGFLRRYIIFCLLISGITIPGKSDGQVNNTSFDLRVPESRNTIEIRAEGINCSSNDWNILRDSLTCYPLIVSLSNPLNREATIDLSFSEVTYRNRRWSGNVSFQTAINVPAKSTTSRLIGIPLSMIPVFKARGRNEGRLNSERLAINAVTSIGGREIQGGTSLDFNIPNYWGGSSYNWDKVVNNAEGVRTLVVSPVNFAAKKEMRELKDKFKVIKSWSVEILPQTSRPLAALQRLVLFGVDPKDLSKGQRDAIDHAVSGGLDVYLISASSGEGADWTREWSEASQGVVPRVEKQGFGTWVAYSAGDEVSTIYPPDQMTTRYASRRNLAKLGVSYLDKVLRPGDPSDLTLFLMAGYVLLLIPGVFFTLKKRKKSNALLWLIPAFFVGSVVLVTMIGFFHYGVMEKTSVIAGVVQASGGDQTRGLQLIEGRFDPHGSKWERTLAANEDLILDLNVIQSFASIRLIENPDGTMNEICATYPRSLNFRVRSLPIDQEIQLAKPELVWPANSLRLPIRSLSVAPFEPSDYAVNNRIADITDIEVLDRFGIEPGLQFIGLQEE